MSQSDAHPPAKPLRVDLPRKAPAMSDMTDASISKAHWYDKNGSVILLLIVFFPIGLYGMWKGRRFPVLVRSIITAFFALFVIGQIRKDLQQHQEPESSPSTIHAATPQHDAAAQISGEKSDIAALKTRVDSALQAYNQAVSKNPIFQITGKITSRTQESVVIWGLALPTGDTAPQALGGRFEEGNIIIRDYPQENVHYDAYSGQAYFIKSVVGQNSLGATVPAYLYSGVHPDKSSVEKLRKEYETAENDLKRAEAPLKAEQQAISAPILQKSLEAMNLGSDWTCETNRSKDGLPYLITWKNTKDPSFGIQLTCIEGYVAGTIQGPIPLTPYFQKKKIGINAQFIAAATHGLAAGLSQGPNVDYDKIAAASVSAINTASDDMQTNRRERVEIEDFSIGNIRFSGETRSPLPTGIGEPPPPSFCLTLKLAQ